MDRAFFNYHYLAAAGMLMAFVAYPFMMINDYIKEKLVYPKIKKDLDFIDKQYIKQRQLNDLYDRMYNNKNRREFVNEIISTNDKIYECQHKIDSVKATFKGLESFYYKDYVKPYKSSDLNLY